MVKFRVADDGSGRIACAEERAVGEEAALLRPYDAANDETLATLVKICEGLGRDEVQEVAVKAEEEENGGNDEEED